MFVKVASPMIGEEELAAVREALLQDVMASGPKVAEFEQSFAAYVGTSQAVAVNTGTAAIQAGLSAIDLQPGDEVIVPALTFFATASAVMHQGGVPVFADISLDNFCIDPDDLPRCLTPRTKAIIVVHYFGHAAEMDAINAFARAHDLTVIEDCAQSHGTTYKGRMTGSIGDMGAFSFFATKHMTTGEGGIVTTNSGPWSGHMRQFRSHGMTGRHDHGFLGYNYRMTEVEGALGVEQLKKLDGFNARRIEVSERLIDRIRDIPWLEVPRVPSHVRHTYFWLHILIDEEALGFSAQDLIARLAERGVETRNRYIEPLYRQPVLNECLSPLLRVCAGSNLPEYGSLRLPGAERAAGKVIGLPNRPDLSDAEMDYVSDVLHAIAE